MAVKSPVHDSVFTGRVVRRFSRSRVGTAARVIRQWTLTTFSAAILALSTGLAADQAVAQHAGAKKRASATSESPKSASRAKRDKHKANVGAREDAKPRAKPRGRDRARSDLESRRPTRAAPAAAINAPRNARGAPAAAGVAAVVAGGVVAGSAVAASAEGGGVGELTPAVSPGATPMRGADRAEARLLEVYRLWGQGDSSRALVAARELVRDHPNFQAAQLIYGDLLSLRLPPPARKLARQGLNKDELDTALEDLRAEQARRLAALRHRPAAGTVPSQLLAVPPGSRYALAVDVSRSRLYVLRNTPQGLVLERDFYVSIGKAGAGKRVEGDARTPLGIYHITSNLSPKGLRDFYGAGALPINYPNPYDLRMSRTGGGIWLHGVPPTQYARPPLATDGCVVLADNDLRQLVRIADIGATVVLIAEQIDWVAPNKLESQYEALRWQVQSWRDARANGDLARWQHYYLPDATRSARLERRYGNLAAEMAHMRRQPPMELKDISVMRWRDQHDLMVVSFGEVARGARLGATRKQYWLQAGQGWKIFHEELL